jgi:DNA-binding PadR family transcriptional regulator
MSSSWSSFDLRSIAEAVRENVRQFGGFSPNEVKRAAATGSARLRYEILAAVDQAPMTGFEIQGVIGETSSKPSSSNLYPLLEQLVDEGLLKATVKKDRRIFSLTEAGDKEQKASQPDAAREPLEEGAAWLMPNWVDLRGSLPKSLGRLAKLSVEVSQRGTKEQQEQAAAAIDETVKKLHKILAAE